MVYKQDSSQSFSLNIIGEEEKEKKFPYWTLLFGIPLILPWGKKS